MSEDTFRRNNHYVSRGYLKRWGNSQKRVWSYRTLVSRRSVPLWKQRSTRGVAYHSHLYTRLVTGRETDEIERWLETELETPAAGALEKATSGARLTPNDWKLLVRFLSAQHVRTPARLFDNLQHWAKELPELLESTLKEATILAEIADEDEARAKGIMEQRERQRGHSMPPKDGFPFRLTKRIKPGEEYGELKGEILAGRSLWLWSIRHALTNTAKALHDNRWSIVSPPEGLTWFTSDDPVVCLNYYERVKYGRDKYDFKGGWANPGSEILMPLSPSHLLYTQVGKRPPARGDVMPLDLARLIRRFIAEHADRMIFSSEPDPEVAKLRPRIVDAEKVKSEREQWKTWHEEQSAAERGLMGWGKS